MNKRIKFRAVVTIVVIVLCMGVFGACSQSDANSPYMPPESQTPAEDVTDIPDTGDEDKNIEDSSDDNKNNDNENDDSINGDSDETGNPVKKDPFYTFTLEDGKSYTGSSLSFAVGVFDGNGTKIPNGDISFSVDLSADDGVENFVDLQSEDITLVWSDDSITSYKINFTKGIFDGCKNIPMILRITACLDGIDFDKTVEITYVGAGADGYIGDIVLSVEGFTIGCGYFAAPQYVSVYDGVPLSKTLTDFISSQGWDCDYSGRIESGFYLEAISGLDLTGNAIPADLLAHLTDVWDESGDYLGEFCFTSGSGWMYSANGIFPNYGFSDYFPQDGDVIRVVFTLCFGSDVGGGRALGGGGSSDFADFADYTEIMNLFAYLRENDFFGKGAQKYSEDIEKVSVWNAGQELIDACVAELTEFYA